MKLDLTPELSPQLFCFRDIDKVDDLMQDITEQQELAQEISDAISKPVGLGEQFDEVGVRVQLLEIHLWVLASINLEGVRSVRTINPSNRRVLLGNI